MIFTSRFGGFGGAWEDWCSAHYGPGGTTPDPSLYAKCSSNIPFVAPWTVMGRSLRGLPATDPTGTFAPPVSGSGLISGLSSNTMLLGMALAGVALVMTLRKKRRGRK